MQRSDDPQAADVFDFVDAFLAARERGEDPPLAYWLERFPTSQEAIAREWIQLRGSDSDAGAPEGALFVAPIESGPDRIGPYRLIGELGRGGQGTVFLAEDTRILRRVALKVLASRFDTISDEKLRRFRREAEIIARLEHPSLCTVYDADLTGEVPYIAMRFVEGRTLADVLIDARKPDDSTDRVRLDAGDETTPRAADAHFPPGSTLELNQVLLFFERSARALHAAHEAGVVHRDVKPGNVIVTTDGKPVLLDFGLARDEREGDGARITESGEVFGTPAYMSPEQLEFSSDQLDRRTDVYSLGVALYEALTLHRPFEQAVRPALYTAIQSQPPPDPRSFNADLPTDVAVVLETALEKDRGRRYQTALALAEDLRRIRQYEPIRARPAGMHVRFARWVRRHPALAAATIGTILSLSAGLAVALHLLDATNIALVQKDDALSVALGKHLAQRSVQLVSQDASAALALGVEAVERAPGYLTRSALYPALENCWLEHVLSGEDTAVLATCLEIAPGGDLVAAGFDDGLALVWELDTGRRVARIALGRKSVDAIAWDPTGARLALATRDGALTFVDPRTGAVQKSVALRETAAVEVVFAADRPADVDKKPEEVAKCVAFSPDGARCFVRTSRNVLTLVDPTRGAFLIRHEPCTDARWLDADGLLALIGGSAFLLGPTLEPKIPVAHGFRSPIVACDVSDDGKRFALGNSLGEVEVVDAATFEASSTSLSGGPVRCLDLSPAGDRVSVLVGNEEEVRPWIWSPGENPVELDGHGRRIVSCARFSPDGQRVATASHDLTLRVWDAATGGLQNTFTLPLRHVDVRWSPDGGRLVSRSIFLVAHVWYTRPRADSFDLVGHVGPVRTLEASADGTRVLSGGADGSVRLWALAQDPRGSSPQLLGTPFRTLEHGAPLLDARFVDGSGSAVTVGEDGVVRAWSGASGAQIGESLTIVPGVATIDVAPDGRSVAILDRAGGVRLWHPLEDPQRVERVFEPAESVRATCAAFLRDGQRLAIGCSDGKLWIRGEKAHSRVDSRSFARGSESVDGVLALAVHPGRDEVAVACGDKRVRFWRVGDEQESRPEAFTFDLRSIAWDPLGERVLTLGRLGGNAARVVEIARHETVRPRNPHTGDITCAAFSPDGALALTGASDGSLFVWSTKDGEPVVQREDLGAPVRCARFVRRAEGLAIVAGLEDGRVCVWPVDPLEAARKRMPRQLLSWERDRERALAAPLPYD